MYETKFTILICQQLNQFYGSTNQFSHCDHLNNLCRRENCFRHSNWENDAVWSWRWEYVQETDPPMDRVESRKDRGCKEQDGGMEVA